MKPAAPTVAFPDLVRARFVERPNRFVVNAVLDDGRPAVCHLGDPGRLVELLVPGAPLFVAAADAPHRKTAWTVKLVEAPSGDLVSVDTTLPNRLVARALAAGALEELAGWSVERREFTVGGSRFDFLLRRPGRTRLLEVKSVTLVEGGVALFPDAVTARGARHLRELAAEASAGRQEAAVLFVVQRRVARLIRAAREIDPAFADALAGACRAGVELLGRRCRVGVDGVVLAAPIPVDAGA